MLERAVRRIDPGLQVLYVDARGRGAMVADEPAGECRARPKLCWDRPILQPRRDPI